MLFRSGTNAIYKMNDSYKEIQTSSVVGTTEAPAALDVGSGGNDTASEVIEEVPTISDEVQTVELPTEEPVVEESVAEEPVVEPTEEPIAEDTVKEEPVVEATEEPVKKEEPAEDASTKETYSSYIVKDGDSLGSIAENVYKSIHFVNRIKEINNISDEDKICVGQKLWLPNQ